MLSQQIILVVSNESDNVNLTKLTKLCPDENFVFCTGDQLQETDLLRYFAIISDTPNFSLFKQYRSKSPDGTIVLLTDMPMSAYSKDLNNQEDTLVDHLISTADKSDYLLEELQATIKKLTTNNIFGLERYISSENDHQEVFVRDSDLRNEIKEDLVSFFKRNKIPKPTIRSARSIAEEFLLNALYDAPQAGGLESHIDIGQTSKVKLSNDHQGVLRYFSNDKVIGLSISDPFGKLKKETFFKYIKKALMTTSSDELIDNKKIGAGLGLYKVLTLSHAIICNISPNKRTELISLIYYKEPLGSLSRTPRSIHFFEEK